MTTAVFIANAGSTWLRTTDARRWLTVVSDIQEESASTVWLITSWKEETVILRAVWNIKETPVKLVMKSMTWKTTVASSKTVSTGLTTNVSSAMMATICKEESVRSLKLTRLPASENGWLVSLLINIVFEYFMQFEKININQVFKLKYWNMVRSFVFQHLL